MQQVIVNKHTKSKSLPGVLGVEKSGNEKIGFVSTTWVSIDNSCPPSRPYFTESTSDENSPCYARNGRAGMVERRISKGVKLTPIQIARNEARVIDSLESGRMLRLKSSGDTRTVGGAKLIDGACERYVKRFDDAKYETFETLPWSYAHNWRKIKRAAFGKFISILASCEKGLHVTIANKMGYAAAIVLPYKNHPSAKVYDYDGVKVIPCPAQTKGKTCKECGLCMRDTKIPEGYAVGFAAHGTSANKVIETLQNLS